MNPPDLTYAAWRTSSHSGSNGGQCVEVAFLDTVVGVRDSKDRGTGPVLMFTTDEWKALIAGVVDRQFG